MKRIMTAVMLLCAGFQLQAQTTYSLADCRNMATTHSREVKIAAEKVEAAENLRKAARTQYLPSVSANGGYLHNEKSLSLLGEDQYLPVFAYNADGSVNYAASWNNSWTSYMGQIVPTDATGMPFNPTTNPEKILWKNKAYIPKDAFEFDTRNVVVGAVTVTQPLFMGGKVVQMNKLADSNKKLAEAQEEGELSQTILNTDVAYWRIISLASREKLTQGYVDLLKKLESDIDKAIAAGVATKSDGLTVKVRLNEAEMSRMQVQDGLSLSRMALCQVCGLPLESSFRLEDELLDTLHETVENVPLTGASVYDRYEVKGLIQAVNMAKSAEKIAASRFLPNAALTAGYMVTNPSLYNGFEKEYGGQYQVGVVVNVPLFHFGERVHTLRSARNDKNIAQYKLEDAREKIELDIMQARFKNNEAIKKVQLTASNKDKAEENLHYATIGFEAGTITASTLMEAQVAWMKACSEDIDARIDVQLTRVQLQKALGNLF